MRPVLVVFSYSGQDDMLDRHWPGYVASGCDILVSSPVDAPCRRGGLCHARSQRFGPELMKRIFWTFKHVLQLGYDTHYFIEGDSVVLGKPPTKLEGGLHGFLWDNAGTEFLASKYVHWSWGLNRATLTKLTLMGDRFQFDAEDGWPDRQIGFICEQTGIPMIHRPDLNYSRNALDTPEYMAQARAAKANGAVFIHGVKHEAQLKELMA